MSDRWRMVGGCLGALALAIAGCQGSDGPICEIEGVLQYKGQPIPGVQLTFEPDDFGTKSTSFAMTDENGRFVMFIGGTQGVFKGRVRVRCDDPLAAMGQQTPIPAEIEPRYRELCEKYGTETSKYMLTIEKANKNLVLDLD